MEWNEILTMIFEMILFPAIGVLSIWLCMFISAKISELKQKTKNELAHKYLSMLDNTITNAVLTTTQTYVETLKKQGKFDEAAQKEAFNKTYETVMKLLTDEAKVYIAEAVGDVEVYITNKIESEVKLTKNY
jgi:hypothetical protein